jgi:hypothetical protein
MKASNQHRLICHCGGIAEYRLVTAVYPRGWERPAQVILYLCAACAALEQEDHPEEEEGYLLERLE